MLSAYRSSAHKRTQKMRACFLLLPSCLSLCVSVLSDPLPPADDKVGGDINYLVECDADCTEACFKVEETEVIEQPRALCTAKDALYSKTCAKCDARESVPLDESSSRLLMFAAAGVVLF